MAATFALPTTRPRVSMLIASPDSQFRRRWLIESGANNKSNHEVEGGAHALAKLKECDCDRVVLDRRLPDLDAREVAGLIRQRYPRTSIEMVDSRRALENMVESAVELDGRVSESSVEVAETDEIKIARDYEFSPDCCGEVLDSIQAEEFSGIDSPVEQEIE